MNGFLILPGPCEHEAEIEQLKNQLIQREQENFNVRHFNHQLREASSQRAQQLEVLKQELEASEKVRAEYAETFMAHGITRVAYENRLQDISQKLKAREEEVKILKNQIERMQVPQPANADAHLTWERAKELKDRIAKLAEDNARLSEQHGKDIKYTGKLQASYAQKYEENEYLKRKIELFYHDTVRDSIPEDICQTNNHQ